jgi:hypothetical protein
MHIIREQKHTGMPDNDVLPSWEIFSYLICILISIAMIWYIHLGVNFWNVSHVPLSAILFLTGFCVIIWYCSMKLVFALLPARKKSCPACKLIAKIIEIEGVSGERTDL